MANKENTLALSDALDYFFDQSFPIIKPSDSTLSVDRKTIMMAMSDELIRSSITIGSDYARLMISVLKYNISEGISNVDALNGGISWLIPIIKRNEQRSQRKGVSGMNEVDLDGGGPELSGLDLYTFKFKVGTKDVTISRYLHTAIMKNFSTLFKRSCLKQDFTIYFTGLNLSDLRGVSTSGDYKDLYIEMLVDMVISLLYCPLLLIDWIFCGKLEVKLECGGNIFDKDFYIMDLKQMIGLFEFTDKKCLIEYIESELIRVSQQANENAEKVVNNWKTTICKSTESDDIYKGSVVFSNNTELDGGKEKRVVIVQDIVNYRSDFFKLMSQSGMKEATDDVIVLECSGNVLKAVFEYAYVGSFSDESIAFELILYSDMIGYRLLFNTCAHIIKKNIKSMDDVLNVYNFAKMYEEIPGLKCLKCYCVKYCYISKYNSKQLEIPREIAQNEPVEDFLLTCYTLPMSKVSKEVHIHGWCDKSGVNRICNVIARKNYYAPPIYTNEGFISTGLINTKTSWKNSSKTNPMLLCVPINLENKEQFFADVEEIIASRKDVGKSHEVLAIVLTKCDIPRGMWTVPRDEMFRFAKKVNVCMFESSAYCGVNCSEPYTLMYGQSRSNYY